MLPPGLMFLIEKTKGKSAKCSLGSGKSRQVFFGVWKVSSLDIQGPEKVQKTA